MMMMNSEMLVHLETRFNFDAWRGRNTREENLFVWRLFLSGNELPGWRAHRIEVLSFEGWPPGIRSMWLPKDGEMESMLQIELFECASAAAAKEFLLRTLGEFESPLLARRTGDDVGDVAFSMGDTNVVYARANVVVIVRNAGASVVPVITVAGTLDAELNSRPETRRQQVAPSITRIEVVPAPSRETFYIELEATDPLGRQVWFKLFADSGEIYAEGDRLHYHSGTDVGTITAVAMNPNGGAASREIRVHDGQQPE